MFIIVVAFLCLTFVDGNPTLGKRGTSGTSEFDIVEALEGESARLTCTSGMATKYCMFSDPNSKEMLNVDPETMSLFRLPDLHMDTSEDVCGIIIPNVTQKHYGMWRCQVHVTENPNNEPGGNWYKNGYTIVNRKLLLHILPPSSQPTYKVEQVSISLYDQKQKKMNLKCPVDGSGQDGIVNWSYNGREPTQTPISEPYSANVKMEDNGGNITCNVSSQSFSEIQIRNRDNIAEVKLNVMYRPIIVNISRTFIRVEQFRSFQVIYMSNPASEMTWAWNPNDCEYQDQDSHVYVQEGDSLINKDMYMTWFGIHVSDVHNENWTFRGNITVQNSMGSVTQEVQLKEFLHFEKFSSPASKLDVYVGLTILLAVICAITAGLLVVYKKKLIFLKGVETHDLLECSLHEDASNAPHL